MKLKILSAVLTAVLLICSASMLGCGKAERHSAVYTDLFDTVIEVIAYTDSQEEFDTLSAEIYGILQKYHRESDIYNKYDGINNAAVLNENAGKSAIEVSQELFDLLKFGKEAYSDSLETVNIMMGAVLRVWDKYRTDGRELPPDEELGSAAGHISVELLELDGDSMTAYISDSDASIDLGAVAKGYAVERVNEYLCENNISGVLINAGGNVLAVGDKPDGRLWTVGIQNPDGFSGDYVKTVSVADKCIVTSGDYQRYYTVDGKKYCHIIDEKTLYPAEYFRSVSVICGDSSAADVLSTALFLLDYETGSELADKYSAKVIWIMSDGQILEN